MRSLLRIAILLALLFSFQSLTPSALLAQDSKETGTITGRVLLDGKPAQGMVVMATPSMADPFKAVEQMLKPPTPLKAMTDADGRYRLEAVPAGKYAIAPSAPASVNTESGAGKEVTVTDATIEDIDFSLSLGGVITGTITDSEGRPVIAEEITLKPVDPSKPGGSSSRPGGRMYATDDRGIYRIFALAPGRYIVSAGSSRDPITSLFAKRPKRVQTYYPGVTEETKARPVEVIAGVEASGVDIRLGASDKGFTVNGRVLAVETGAPIANAMVGYEKRAREGSPDAERRHDSLAVAGGITTTNAKGEFRFDSVLPGNYAMDVSSLGPALAGGSEFYVDPVNFEVQSGNIDKLEIKVHLGASISGVVVVDGVDAANTLDHQLPSMLIAVGVTSSSVGGKVGADGSFRIGGLKAGKTSIRSVPYAPYGAQKFSVLRIERNGVEQLDGIDVQPNEQITGVRVVVVQANCVIRGHVTLQGGPLPPGSEISVRARASNGDPNIFQRPFPVDSKGNFVIEDLAPGDYEVEATSTVPGPAGSRRVSAKQSVTVTSASPAQTTLVLDLSSKGPDK